MGRGHLAAVDAALTDEFVFAEDRHGALLQALSLPVPAAGWGFRYLERNRGDFAGPPLRRAPLDVNGMVSRR